VVSGVLFTAITLVYYVAAMAQFIMLLLWL